MDQALTTHSVVLSFGLFDMFGSSGVRTNQLPIQDSI